LVPATAALATVAAVYLYAARYRARSGLLAALLLLSASLFVGVARFANFDALLTCVSAIAVFGFARWLDRADGSGCPMYVYALAGVGVLVKGPVAAVLIGVPVLVAALYLRATGGPWGAPRVVLGASVASVVVAVWALPVAVLHPDYLYEFVWTHNLRRYFVGDADMFHPEPFWYFLPVMFATMLPWGVLVPKALVRVREASAGERFLALFAVWVVVFFSASSGKLATYVLPAYPALAVLVAAHLERAACDPFESATDGRRLLRGVGFLFGFLVPASIVALFLEAPGFEYTAFILLPISCVGLAIASGHFGGDGTARALATRLSVATVATYLAMLVVLGNEVGKFTSDRDLALEASKPHYPRTTVVYRVRPFSYLFYLGRPVVYKRPDTEFLSAITDSAGALVLTKERHLDSLRDLVPGLSWVEVARNYRHVLLSTLPEVPAEAPDAE
jgi:4-amino-4-deoxy-L-arabinose transferase-like glycosyltransferase